MDWLQTYWTKITDYFADTDQMANLFGHLIKIVLIFIAARILILLADKTIHRIMEAKERNLLKIDHRRANTIGKLIHNTLSYTINFIAILLILGQLGINLGPLLAGAGVLGLAIGFGAQSLVKDVITGFFIIFEDQFAVGDVIQIGQQKGTVEQIGIRVTRLRSWTGEVHIIPNGSITQVTNFSLHNSLAVVDVTIGLDADTDQALEVLRETAKRIAEQMPQVAAEPKVLGVQALGQTGIVLRVTAECLPNQQVDVSRAMFAEIKKDFDRQGIEIPYPRSVTYMKTERAAE